jgi:hypothetical protein
VQNDLPWSDFDESLRAVEAVTPAHLDQLAAAAITPASGVLVLVGDRATVIPQLQGTGLTEPRIVSVRGE